MAKRFSLGAGLPSPLGVTLRDGGINVAVVSRHAERVDLCLFDRKGEAEITRLPLTRIDDETHCGFVAGVKAGARYGLRAEGPHDPRHGHRFDPAKLLVDPYAATLDRPFALVPELSAQRSAAIDTAAFVPKAIVGTIAPAAASKTADVGAPGFVYEVAVKAFTHDHPKVPQRLRGTVAALAHPRVIEHLAKLGVDTVELMPIAAWIDERHLPPLGLHNAWGYNPIAFMAPDPRLAPKGLAEIAAAVAALHAAGMRVILDAVFNHSGESDTHGPTLSLRGLDNALYYRHAVDHPGRLINDTGCGNTLASDRPAVVRLVTDAMRHWMTATGVDGFRLDLAAALGRTDHGFAKNAPLFQAIAADPLLGRAIMIAEPWDVGPGGYQLGHFPNGWGEWNDRFRDDVRRFWRGDSGALGSLATRLAGSADVFGDRRPSASVNFLAAHDGFALADLVSFAHKHNQANGEHNRDGTSENFSWNNGAEGASDDPAIVAARRRDMRALLATLFISRGTPMLTAGDEFGRSQRGNNNAYAQDNDITWLDWAHADTALIAFTARLVALRKRHPALSADRFLTGLPVDETGIADATWLSAAGAEMTVAEWETGEPLLGLALYAPGGDDHSGDRVAIWLNGSRDAATGWLPHPRSGFAWQPALDSGSADDPTADAGVNLPPRSLRIFVETWTA